MFELDVNLIYGKYVPKIRNEFLGLKLFQQLTMLASLVVPFLLCFLNVFLNVTQHLEAFSMGRFIMFRPRVFRDGGCLA